MKREREKERRGGGGSRKSAAHSVQEQVVSARGTHSARLGKGVAYIHRTSSPKCVQEFGWRSTGAKGITESVVVMASPDAESSLGFNVVPAS
jgi:hypothetical protein